MEAPRNLQELQYFLDAGGRVDASFPVLLETGSWALWTLLQRAAVMGTPAMVSFLLEKGASMKSFTDENKSAVDLANEAGNWETFEILKTGADLQHPQVQIPPRAWTRSFYPSEFFLKLRGSLDRHQENLNLDGFEDLKETRRRLAEAGIYPSAVQYADENPHLIEVPNLQIQGVTSHLYQQGKLLNRALAFAEFWLDRCLKNHRHCSETRPFSDIVWPSLPKRVVDVSGIGNGRVKLVPGSPSRSPYCAISYRWKEHAVKTTSESIASFSSEIPLDGLQTQLKDAFMIANALGIRYVWVDALCIVQKSEAGAGDFSEEASKMASVYGNATLTLSFTDDVRFGSTSEKKPVSQTSRPLGDLDNRGWVLQEQLLSQRVLYITRNGLFWECLENSMSESQPCGIAGPSDNFLANDYRKLQQLTRQSSLSAENREELMNLWRKNIVEEYSKRSLIYDEDKLVAAASIASRLNSALSSECVLGIWRWDAARSLVWHSAKPSTRPRNIVFPSWSWYSISGLVVCSAFGPFDAGHQRNRWSYGLTDDMRITAEVLSISSEQDQHNLNVYRGRVKVKGLTVKAYFAPAKSNGLLFPRRRGGEDELLHDLQNGTLKRPPFDSGIQLQYPYVGNPAFIDNVDYPGPKYRKVVCMIMGSNIRDGFPIALVFEKVNESEEYERVGLVAIDGRHLNLQAMGEMRTLTIV